MSIKGSQAHAIFHSVGNAKRESLLEKIKAQIVDEEEASKMYYDMSKEVLLFDILAADELLKISNQEATHKTMLENMYNRLGGKT